ncbi:hypothetical protein I4F81_006101 [Pyropia yezoensis]|uniref:Uncharacterized protein n=1 Tax=Pyropia yezoensis TaxID=2788 RepID=A0ACC3C0S1_PYRYE|nr:hypothetical protein I4F81_006101 [Neopyropia yezoensis]
MYIHCFVLCCAPSRRACLVGPRYTPRAHALPPTPSSQPPPPPSLRVPQRPAAVPAAMPHSTGDGEAARVAGRQLSSRPPTTVTATTATAVEAEAALPPGLAGAPAAGSTAEALPAGAAAATPATGAEAEPLAPAPSMPTASAASPPTPAPAMAATSAVAAATAAGAGGGTSAAATAAGAGGATAVAAAARRRRAVRPSPADEQRRGAPRGSYKSYYARRMYTAPADVGGGAGKDGGGSGGDGGGGATGGADGGRTGGGPLAKRARTGRDPRLELLTAKRWFPPGAAVLDVGCNNGTFTLAVATALAPRLVVGIDVDAGLVAVAKRKCEGPATCVPHGAAATEANANAPGECAGAPAGAPPPFPPVTFHVADFSTVAPAGLPPPPPGGYDVVLMLSVSKWIHLAAGDAGLQAAFRAAAAALSPTGVLVLEPQGLNSYKAARRKGLLTPAMEANAAALRMLPPDGFQAFLLGEGGFARVECLRAKQGGGVPFDRPVYAYYKATAKVEAET